MRAFFFLSTFVAVAILPAAEPSLTADEIMTRVAVNQDDAQRARESFVYRQNIKIRLRDNHNKLVREEVSEYQVTPDAHRTRKELVNFTGRYAKGHSMIPYGKSGVGQDEGWRNQLDGDLVRDFRDDLTGDRKSRDGISPRLFPLTAKQQRKYRFELKGEEKYQGQEVFRVAFQPNRDIDETCWKGEALISKSDFQPLFVTTKLAFGIPFLVRTALGTNIQGLGFSVQYQKFGDGVWFPVSYGTEFRIHAVFVYSRQVSISMVNSDFRRADVNSTVEFDTLQ